MTVDSGDRDRLRLALQVAIGALLIAIPPIWPYGLYVLVRLVVTAAAVYGLFVLRGHVIADSVGLALVALLFNPIVPVHLPKLLWVLIDLGVAGFLWSVIARHLTAAASPRNSDTR